MIFTLDTLTNQSIQLAGLALVLRPVPSLSSAIPLSEWLNVNSLIPAWIPLAPKMGTIKVLPVLPDMKQYPSLFQRICQQLAQANAIEVQNRCYEIIGVETQTDDLFVVQLSLFYRQPLPATLNRAIHGLCLQWFANADPVLAEKLHQSAETPFTVSVKSKDRQQLQIRIAILQRELLAPLLWGLRLDLGQEVSITDVACQVSSQVRIVASNHYHKLIQVSPRDPLELEFLSPTSFKQRNIVQPFPLPELVFGGLLRRWNAFAPKPLAFEQVDWSCLVAAFDLKTHALRMKSDEIGSQGRVRYRFPDREQAAIATTLAHFAYFAGVGRKTAMGMGQTQLSQRKEQDE